jgi:hypothetical protein
MPKLSDHDLKQMDAVWLDAQPEGVVRGVLARALDDLRVARDRLNQNPGNSSRPSGSMAPWARTGVAAAVQQQLQEAAQAPANPEPAKDETVKEEAEPEPLVARPAVPAARAGRRLGGIGHARTQKLAPTQTLHKYPSHCGGCQRALTADASAQAWTGWDTLELEPLEPLSTGAEPVGVLGLRIQVSRHCLMEQTCQCGHRTRAEAARLPHDADWPGVDISEQRLLGPRLSAVVVYLCIRMRLPRRKVQELLMELFGLSLSTALIDQTLKQTARSIEPVQAQLAQDLEQAALVHADETSWPEAGAALWLWVLCCTHTVLYVIGSRGKEMLGNALSLAFAGALMSDGYSVYRERTNRLRCWAHLLRKLRGLTESTDRTAARAGVGLLEIFTELMDAVYTARAQLQTWQIQCQIDPDLPRPEPPSRTHAHLIEKMRQLCEQQREAPHLALGSVAREFLYDWDAIMRVLAQPQMPLTNNAAERQLRHWVIARRISYGTRTLTGSNSFALLASVIDTCRLRGASVTNTLAQAIHAARQGWPAPALPPIPLALRTHQLAMLCD